MGHLRTRAGGKWQPAGHYEHYGAYVEWHVLGTLTNTRTQPSCTIDTALDQMVWDLVNKVPGWNS
jgi:hypothetical protein